MFADLVSMEQNVKLLLVVDNVQLAILVHNVINSLALEKAKLILQCVLEEACVWHPILATVLSTLLAKNVIANMISLFQH